MTQIDDYRVHDVSASFLPLISVHAIAILSPAPSPSLVGVSQSFEVNVCAALHLHKDVVPTFHRNCMFGLLCHIGENHGPLASHWLFPCVNMFSSILSISPLLCFMVLPSEPKSEVFASCTQCELLLFLFGALLVVSLFGSLMMVCQCHLGVFVDGCSSNMWQKMISSKLMWQQIRLLQIDAEHMSTITKDAPLTLLF